MAGGVGLILIIVLVILLLICVYLCAKRNRAGCELYVCVCTYVYICVYVYVCACMCVCMYVFGGIVGILSIIVEKPKSQHQHPLVVGHWLIQGVCFNALVVTPLTGIHCLVSAVGIR